VTGEPVATVSSGGVDFAATARYAREVGGPTLRAMTFHERAALLKALGRYLLAGKETLYDLSTATGATRSDSWVDIEGGAGVLLGYASKGRRELPNATVLLDGDPEILARDGSFIAAHIATPLHGVAVQVNAFNFPCWGALEKLAPALLAGVPSIVKPATQTAFLTEAMVRLIVESEILPEGALQLVCGGIGDLFDHLTGQDLVGFTGSASTAALLRVHPTVIGRSVRFNAEADSLNAAILGPSAGPGTVEFDLFVSEVVQEMISKAGQKCTAIRRALVPARHLDAAAEALSAALADVRVGDPGDEDTDMGALVSTAQRDEVLRAVAALSGSTTTVTDTCGFHGVDPDIGAFLAPTLLRADDPTANVVHTTEAFGPVSTLIGYDDIADAIRLTALGEGSLVASVYSGDTTEAAAIVLGIAAHHGRVHVVDASVAATSTGHGSPLPNLVHGGPGRAGGGEEMGGLRGVRHHLQTTAVQGSPDMLTAITGEWMPGATRHLDRGHPFKLHFEDLEVGTAIRTASRTVTLDDIEGFAESTGDHFYAHMDEEAAAASPIFGGRVAHGYLVLSLAAGLFVWPDPGPVLANYGIDRCRFARPTYPGDTLTVFLTCKRRTLRAGTGYGEVAWDAQVVNQNDDVVAAYDVLTMVANHPGVNGAAGEPAEAVGAT
jgi:oxepin-CoA hydrolase/3-oxo-5,6-dehydrosuberyl-CoA semialdehyde dehydrogenase